MSKEERRAFLVSSRSNSRPGLARYAASSSSLALPAASPARHAGAEEQSATEQEFARRRAAVLAKWGAMPAGCVQEDACDETEEEMAEESKQRGRGALEELKRDSMGPGTGCYSAGYAEGPLSRAGDTKSNDETTATGNYATLPSAFSSPFVSSTSGDAELTRLEQFHRYLAELAADQRGSSFRERMRKYEQLTAVVENFLQLAECYGKVILQEIGKPAEQKTIKPLQSTGVGFVFLVCFVFVLTLSLRCWEG
jgi:hypothetical protein